MGRFLVWVLLLPIILYVAWLFGCKLSEFFARRKLRRTFRQEAPDLNGDDRNLNEDDYVEKHLVSISRWKAIQLGFFTFVIPVALLITLIWHSTNH
ncbi:hypothetical protein ACFOY8_13985 [Thalassospira xianhensis]|uniref:Lipoprotein n=1 Tax=Thalassospira xianhensis MCCC 1A02616 TaxID=1177929 RepID=A0A367UHT4_9PROT|nr:hypothetical protein [Thalassospira xianhensis]RCK07729.1 hypothetical protein TH5_01285 [Thalassospira xianhensis MCCC 1A02616]